MAPVERSAFSPTVDKDLNVSNPVNMHLKHRQGVHLVPHLRA